MIKFLVENSKDTNKEEYQYLKLIKYILLDGTVETGRNGNTYSAFKGALYFSLENNRIPLLTTKQLAWKTCLKELFWFIRGDTDNRKLIDQNVHIWDANSSRSFLDSRWLLDREENDLGPIYGFQWRHFNAPYTNCHILRKLYDFPTIKIHNQYENINDYTMEDIEIINYKYHPKISMNMRS